jgi:hypothetical protein
MTFPFLFIRVIYLLKKPISVVLQNANISDMVNFLLILPITSFFNRRLKRDSGRLSDSLAVTQLNHRNTELELRFSAVEHRLFYSMLKVKNKKFENWQVGLVACTTVQLSDLGLITQTYWNSFSISEKWEQ